MCSDSVVVSVRGLAKTFRLFAHPGDRIKQFLGMGVKQYHRSFTALDDVSFDIEKGETVGVIGSNGSGKSTLLQLICGILKPTSGQVRVSGRISALLELGAGFNPEFTGRENVYFQGALMGLGREEVDNKFDDIAAFADIDEFIDQPVRTYSSGMFVRLAFSVAVSVDPDILVVDEALAVGDVAFQAKCFRRMGEIRERGGAILLVSHAAEQIAHFCDRAILLDHGKMVFAGDAGETLDCYARHLHRKSGEEVVPEAGVCNSEATDDTVKYSPGYNPDETRWGDRAASITGVCLIQGVRENPVEMLSGVSVEAKVDVYFHADIKKPIYGMVIKTLDGAILFQTNSKRLAGLSGVSEQKAGDSIVISFGFTPFLDVAEYLVSFGVVSDVSGVICPHDRRYDVIKIKISHPMSEAGDIDMRPVFRVQDTAG